MIGSAGRFGRNGGRVFFDEDREPTIWTVLTYLAILIFAGGCFYLFLVGLSGEFGEVRQRKPWEISSAADDRVVTSGHGFYNRRDERREGRNER